MLASELFSLKSYKLSKLEVALCHRLPRPNLFLCEELCEGGESEDGFSFSDDDEWDGCVQINPAAAFDFAMASSPEPEVQAIFLFSSTSKLAQTQPV